MVKSTTRILMMILMSIRDQFDERRQFLSAWNDGTTPIASEIRPCER